MRKARVFIGLSIFLTACAQTTTVDFVDGAPASQTETSVESVERNIDVTVPLPRIPGVVIPDLSELTEVSEQLENELGDLVNTSGTGVDVLTTSCAADSGELVYSGTDGNDIFEVATDGSGFVTEETASGRLELVVESDGSGTFSDTSQVAREVAITVDAEGFGNYFRSDMNKTTTIRSQPDGTGEFRFERGGSITDISIDVDGIGTLVNTTARQQLEVVAGPDGFGSYSLRIGERTVDVVSTANGWSLDAVSGSRRVAYQEAADGAFQYVERGLRSVDLAVESGGEVPAWFEVPDDPEFTVAGAFPKLGQLGTLSPACASVIRFDSTLLFEVGLAAVQPGAGVALDEVAAALSQSGKPIEINGHTDSSGSEGFNDALSIERARAVEAELLSRGVSVPMEVQGFGESQPVAENDNPDGSDNIAGRAQNRRVEIVIRD